ncbi:AAA family ATPase [Bavariicoccus seileri]|uniref:AAA family ATPase n=1 Tax=Bavariicoccus seileri TaxID=549685 RepID=UPI0003B2FCE6|nr:AAA family ATPase [Bavariicoccus seileri]
MIIDLSCKRNIFSDKEIELKSKNFIFGKNGSGKSTLCDLIKLQKHYIEIEIDEDGQQIEKVEYGERVFSENQKEKYDVRIYQGFESVIGENNKLNAIALSGENKKVGEKIRIAESELKKLKEEQELIEEKVTSAKEVFDQAKKNIEAWYKKASKSIKENTQYQVDPNYNKAKFEKDIKKRKRVDNLEELKATMKEVSKKNTVAHHLAVPNLKEVLVKVNKILSKTVKFSNKCEELDSSEKEQFARQGKQLHEEGQKCLFCQGIITKERLERLNQHFNEEYQKLEKEISNFKLEKITLSKLNQQDFYAKFSTAELNHEILQKEVEINEFIETIQKSISKKENNISEVYDALDIEPPNIKHLQNKVNRFISDNNQFGANLSENIAKAKDQIKFHLVYKQCEKFNYEVEKNKLESLEALIPDSLAINRKVADKNKEIRDLKNLQKDTSKIVNLINKRLKKSGKKDIELVKVENNGVETYQILDENNQTRPISRISTGEKNIIAFLYFIYSLEDVENENDKQKIIIFDDPMNSNDDTMQYLIITELQNILKDTKKNELGQEVDTKFKNDFKVIMTHNNHFYLNVKYGIRNYSNNCFYHFRKGDKTIIKLLNSEKEDFKTNYEQLWQELIFLYDSGKPEFMINPIRRICESFEKFNNLDKNKFYRNHPDAKKLLDVNSHSIDDLEADINGKSEDEIKSIFKSIFVDNGFDNHFNAYWPS